MDHRGSQGSLPEHHLTGGRSVALGQDPSALAEGHMFFVICGSGGFWQKHKLA